MGWNTKFLVFELLEPVFFFFVCVHILPKMNVNNEFIVNIVAGKFLHID